MSNQPISNHAATAREGARQLNGKFGTQPLESTELDLYHPGSSTCVDFGPHEPHGLGRPGRCLGLDQDEADEVALSILDRTDHWTPVTAEDLANGATVIRRYSLPHPMVSHAASPGHLPERRRHQYRLATASDLAAYEAYIDCYDDLSAENEDVRMNEAAEAAVAAYRADLWPAPASPTRQTAAPIKRLNLQATNRSAQEFVRLLENGELEMDPPYQRGSVWTTEQQVALIYSLKAGLPVGVVTINDRFSASRDASGPLYAVIDGKQRLTAVSTFLKSEFSVPSSWFEPDEVSQTEETSDGDYVRFSGLTEVGRRRFSNIAQIPISEAKVATVEEEADIFLLLNGGGTPQGSVDMERAAAVASGR